MLKTPENTFYVLDVVRGRWSATDRESIIRQTAALDGPSVRIVVERDPGSAGKDVAESTVRSLAGYAVHTPLTTDPKQVRAEAFAAQCQARNVSLVAGPWNKDYLDELHAFPKGRHDDQIDASVAAFTRLATLFAGGFEAPSSLPATPHPGPADNPVHRTRAGGRWRHPAGEYGWHR
jgi:predicted phage terminase large subunit-like protein